MTKIVPGKCGGCGAEISPGAAPDGLCPRCLLGLALPGDEKDQIGSPVGESSDTARIEFFSSVPADRIGPYRLLQKLGEGGMGEVWEAEQLTPVQRKVALKLIKAGMDSKQIVARFESERQALAMMSHHNIAKVFDAGVTEQGRPYFVMEHVSGAPITEYCDRHYLDTRARLELFTQVCEGVQHAHQKGIIHRDIKPSNVLITMEEGRPLPKIIDFGVAKATQHRLTEKTLFTQLGVLLGTPAYMSPEQADLTGLDVDTRTDVYSLGVLLYELLVGALPFDPSELREAGFDEMRRKIREDEPSRPSARIGTLGDASIESAKQRRASPVTLARDLRGDLDWITLKALEKDRGRRYPSPNDFAEDIRRHLSHEPVVASPPSAVYRARKFARRHAVGVSFAGAVALLILGFAVVMAVQATRIARERDRANLEATTAEQVSEFLVGLFEVSDPSESRGNTITVREVLDEGAEQIEQELAGQPEVRVRLKNTIGHVYRSLGLYESSEPLILGALKEARTALGENHPLTLSSTTELGQTYRMQSRWEEAERVLAEAVEGRREALGPRDPQTLHSMRLLADVYYIQGRYEESEALFLEVRDAWRETVGDDDIATARAVANLARLYTSMGRLKDAESCFLPALDTMRRVLGDDDPDTLIVAYGLARLYRAQGRIDEAEVLLVDTIEKLRRVLGDEHQRVLWAMKILGQVYGNQGRLDDAAETLTRAMSASREVLGGDHLLTRQCMTNLGTILTRQGRHGEAERLLEDALEIYRRVAGEDHPEVFGTLHRLAWLRSRQDRFDEAEELYLEAIAGRRRIYGEDNPWTLRTLGALAGMYRDQRRFPAAESLYREILEIQRREPGGNESSVATTLYNLAAVDALRGDRRAALGRLRESIAAGWTDAGRMMRDDDLASLREAPEFKAMVAELSAPAEGQEPAAAAR